MKQSRGLMALAAVATFVIATYWTSSSASTSATADVPDRNADVVLGQPGFVSYGCNNGGLSAASLCRPFDMAVDVSGNLYVADTTNQRVLGFFDPLATDFEADIVLGQGGSFTTDTPRFEGTGPNDFYYPYAVATDRLGNLYVVDGGHSRVLEFDSPFTTDTRADRVFGQTDFTNSGCNAGGRSSSTLCEPRGLGIDSVGNLYVADTLNSRVLVYQAPLSSDAIADVVFGQVDFEGRVPACNDGLSASSLCTPVDVATDALGNTYIVDSRRVLEYDSPLTTDQEADRVFGQPDFSTNISHNGGVDADSLSVPSGVSVDKKDNVYISDEYGSNRVLQFASPLSTNLSADAVFGQPDFNSSEPNNGGVNAQTLWNPNGVEVDTLGNLYVADTLNDRVLIFLTPGPIVTRTPTPVAAHTPTPQPTPTPPPLLSAAAVTVGSASIRVNQVGSVVVSVSDFPEPGLARWSIDVGFDWWHVDAISCSPELGGVCNPEFIGSNVRTTGTTRVPQSGTFQLGSISFACHRVGVSPLSVTIVVLATEERDVLAAPVDGEITCKPEAQPTPTPGTPPLPAVLVGDASCDGLINSLDAALILQLAALMIQSLLCPSNGDVNGDGSTNPLDAALVLQFAAGLLNGLPP